jgi:hypothetical protein
MNDPLRLVGMTSLGPILSKKQILFQVTCYEGTHPIGIFFWEVRIMKVFINIHLIRMLIVSAHFKELIKLPLES